MPKPEYSPAPAVQARILSGWRPWGLFALVALGCVLAYWPVTKVGLLSDDWGLSIAGTAPWASLQGAWFGGGEGSFFRPIPRLAIYYQARAFGYDGFAQHLISVLLHLGAGFWVFWALKELGRPGAGLVASAVGLFHPVAVETVAWVSSQTDLWHIVFALGAMATLLRVRCNAWLIASALLAVGAYLSKETALILGPFLVAGLLYAAYWIRPESVPRNRLLTSAGIHAVLWIVYLGYRAWRLGSAIPPPMEGDVTLAIASMSLVAVLHELCSPVIVLFEPGSFLREPGAPQWVALLALPVAALILAWLRQHTAALAVVFFAGALVPALRTWSNPLALEGGMRFLYHPLWFFAVAVGLAIEPLLRAAWHRRMQVLVVLVAGLGFVKGSTLVRAELRPFEVAASVRETLREELLESVAPRSNPVLIPTRLPDRIAGAYVFRNGFEEFTTITLGRAVPLMASPTANDIRPGMVFFSVVFAAPGETPYIRLNETLTAFAAGPPPRPENVAPLRVDFGDPTFVVDRLPLSADMRRVARVEDAWRFEITGDDPNIGLPFRRDVPPAAYRRLTVTLEFVDAPATPAEDTFEFIFVPAGAIQQPVTLGRPVEVRPGRQTVVFDLSQSVEWLSAPGLGWLRLDPAMRYRGRLDLVSAVFD